MWVLICQGVSLIMLLEHYEGLESSNSHLDLGAFKNLPCDFSVKTFASW